MSKSRIYQLKITLEEIQPPIWRRIQVPGDVSLLRLHFIIQTAMGWTHTHLHEFQIGDAYHGTLHEDDGSTRPLKDEKDYTLEEVVPTRGREISYLYDFEDGWDHTIMVEEILPASKTRSYPCCLDGMRACPPEDVGGTWGYEEFLEGINNPDHPEHERYLVWIGGSFDPEVFDQEQTNERLKNIDRSEMMRIYDRYQASETGPALKLYHGVSQWLEGLDRAQRTQLSELALRRDAVSMLTHLRDHSVKGTSSTGNLPLKTIRAVAREFVHPPVLDRKIGDRTYKLRTEFDVWPIYFIHTLLEVGGLLDGGPGKKLTPTGKGLRFLDQDPAVQVWFLLETWWYHTNWLVAFTVSGLGDQLPPHFVYATLDLLLSLPVERPLSFEDFADGLLQRSGLKWRSPQQTRARNSLHSGIKNMVVDILERFQAIEKQMADKHTGNVRYQTLHKITLTRLGKGLLQALAGNLY
ncbi:MAG: plasmid pRiA4b ORF-3 family protein [Anaerolineales bacterium]